MSVITASGEVISKSPLNNSSAKFMYSFPKDKRFRVPKEREANCYTLPDVKSQRSTTFGYGTKFDFTKQFGGKTAPYYNIPTLFDSKANQAPAFTFGISRSYYDKVFIESAKMFDKNVPGPGKYNYLKRFGHEAPQFSIGARCHSQKNLASHVKNPGPGHYKNYSINGLGKYCLSDVKNITGIIWSHSKEKRFKENSMNI